MAAAIIRALAQLCWPFAVLAGAIPVTLPHRWSDPTGSFFAIGLAEAVSHQWVENAVPTQSPVSVATQGVLGRTTLPPQRLLRASQLASLRCTRRPLDSVAFDHAAGSVDPDREATDPVRGRDDEAEGEHVACFTPRHNTVLGQSLIH